MEIVSRRLIPGLLQQSNDLFDGKEQRSRAVIISSYTTFAAPHGPLSPRKYRINTLAISQTTSEKMDFQADLNSLDHELSNLPDHELSELSKLPDHERTVINDERHNSKSETSNVSTAVSCLQANDHIIS